MSAYCPLSMDVLALVDLTETNEEISKRKINLENP